MEGNIPIVRDEATVDRILRAYCHLFPEITPELNSYWNFARTPRHGLLPFLTSNFLEAHYGQYLSLHRHIEGMRQDLSLQERAAELMDASRRAGVGLSIGLSPWTDDALLDTWDASKREAVIVLGHDWYPIVSLKKDGRLHDPDSPLWRYGSLHEAPPRYRVGIPPAVLSKTPVVLFLNLVPDFRPVGAKTTGTLRGYDDWLCGFDAVLRSVCRVYERVSIVSWGANTWNAVKPKLDARFKRQSIMCHAKEAMGVPSRYMAADRSIPFLALPHPSFRSNWNQNALSHAAAGFQALGLVDASPRA
ncbi:hypothetical protein OEJ37_13625 [Burkholderia sp. BKH01]|uniref:hypothetical protein n=1 Tax=Burkholderia sp. BKH01 TaxID=2769262 RepID=UPI0021DF5AFF|nr:hypothetical protein [Burkholderia sp. BKH01]MCU9954393.1 hypothetical protein [Burkholderia sp. BKH01]